MKASQHLVYTSKDITLFKIDFITTNSFKSMFVIKRILYFFLVLGCIMKNFMLINSAWLSLHCVINGLTYVSRILKLLPASCSKINTKDNNLPSKGKKRQQKSLNSSNTVFT